jgi:hypothetical protein
MVTGYGGESQGIQGQKMFFFTRSRPTVRPTKPLTKWVLGVPHKGKVVVREAGHTHIHLVPKLKMCGTIPPLPHTSSWLDA